jgi:hypothetical protein
MYLNPSFNDGLALAKQRPDTLRIVSSERGGVGVANGYGATHTCILRKFPILRGGDTLIYNVREGVLYDEGDDECSLGDYPEIAEFMYDFIQSL